MADDIKLRDMPEPLWAWLKERARLHGRTIDQEVVAVLDSVRLGKARVARLLPPESGSDTRRARADAARSAIAALRETRRGAVLGDTRIAGLRAEGRR